MPTISYGTGDGNPLPPTAQYLLAKAGFNRGFYTAEEVLDGLNALTLSDLPVPIGRGRDICYQRRLIVQNAEKNPGGIVFIENLEPDLSSLEEIMKQPVK